METERWRRIKQILQECLEMDPSRRESQLATLCGGDAEMFNEVQSLIRSHGEMGDFLHGSILDSDDEELLTGREVGSYRLCEPIAEGGMGTVYRAVRASDFEKDVAVKLVKRGMDTDFILRRFRRERQILAGLDHPNIARLLDGGATGDGRPYLVMEYIRGEPITHYSQARRLGVRERLVLFRTVCAAVQYAHQHLVVHRDLKPSNILVTSDGVPKLLDFGIAKILEQDVDRTMTSVRMMTPECASPEQVKGQPITTASDIYSLGVLLYQLLTGEPPYHFETTAAEEVARVICETEPRKPSALRPLPPDLDNIVLKAMHKEPALRYVSAEQLSEDIRRFLDGLPVSARKDTFSYRARKFVARHQVSTIAAVVVALSLLAGITATLWEARIARQQAEIATAQRARAEQRFNDVRKLANSLIFEIHDSIQTLPAATGARKLLLERAVQYLDSLAKESSGDTSLQRELATAYQRIGLLQGNFSDANLGETELALTSFRKAIANWEAVAKANPDNVIDQVRVAYGHRILAVMFSNTGRPGARAEIDQALAISGRLSTTHGTVPQLAIERAIEYEVLAEFQEDSGDLRNALKFWQEDLNLREHVQKLNPEIPNQTAGIALATVRLGDLTGCLGSRDEALRLNQSGMNLLKSLDKEGTNGRARRELAITFAKRGDILLMDGRPLNAMESYRQSLSILEPLAKADPQNVLLRLDLAGESANIGRVLVIEGKYADALTMLDRAIRVYAKSTKEDRSNLETQFGLGTSLIWRGEALRGTGRVTEALSSLEDASARFTAMASGPNNSADNAKVALAVSRSKSAGILVALGRTEDASAEFRGVLAILEPLKPDPNTNLPAVYAAADAYFGLGDLSKVLAESMSAAGPNEARQRWIEARQWYRKSASISLKLQNPGAVSPQRFIYHKPAEAARAIRACDLACRNLEHSAR